MLTQFQSYPFEKLRTLLSAITPPDVPPINLTIGEPQFQTPTNIQQSLITNAPLLNKYPKSSGEDYLINAQRAFIDHRYGIELSAQQIIPTFGTREVLFNFPQFYLFGVQNPTIAYPNPFYQIYEGAAIACKAHTILMNLTPQNAFKPSLQALLEHAKNAHKPHIVILNSPNNPTGSVLELDELIEWVQKALEYDFVIVSDECYSELYVDTKPASILEASLKAGNTGFKNILALNSISKRSSAPGLRSGFIAGDGKILKAYNLYRTYIGCAIPLPLQKAATCAWEDFQSPEQSRAIYARNLSIAQEIFPHLHINPYTFYVWLDVGDDEAFCKHLYATEGISVLPGSFLGREGAGHGYVRLALVYDTPTIQNALYRIQRVLSNFDNTKTKK